MGNLEDREEALRAHRERVCGYCGKVFLISDTPTRWVYQADRKGKLVQFCSWKCTRAEEAEHSEALSRAHVKNPLTPEQEDALERTLLSGRGTYSTCKTFHLTENRMINIMRKRGYRPVYNASGNIMGWKEL